MSRRGLVALPIPIVLLAGLLPLPPAVAQDGPSGASPKGSMDSASWHWAERTPNGDPFQQYAPLIEVQLGSGGASTWAATWKLPDTAAGKLTLRLSGLPEAVRAEPAELPVSVSRQQRAPATSCRRTGTAVACDLRAPAGSEGTSAITLTGGRGLQPGRSTVTATLLRDGVPVPQADEEFFLQSRRRTPTEFYVTREGQAIVMAGQPQVHKVAAYRLSGEGGLRVRDLVPRRLREDVRVKGRGWDCGRNGCTLRREIGVGQRAPALGLLWRLENADVRAWPKLKGAKAHTAQWWTRYSGGRLRQDTSLVAAQQQPGSKKQPRTADQILAPSRRALLTTHVQQLGPARIGGDGRYQVRVGNGGSRAAKAVRVRLRAPSHARITRVEHATKWRCARNECRWTAASRPKTTLPPLTVLLRSHGKKTSSQPFVAVASWHSQGKRRQDRGADRSPWLAPLRVKASTTNAVVHSDSGVTTQLMAQIRNTEGSQVHYRWRQTGGPAVTWVGKRAGSASASTASVRFTPPKAANRTPLTFQVTVSGAGARAHDSVSVDVVPAGGETAWDPRRATTVPPTAQDAAARLNAKPDPRGTWQPKQAAQGRINGPGITIAKAGRREVLRLRKVNPGASQIRFVSWRVNGRKVTTRGRVLKVDVPSSRKTPMLATARIHLGNGGTVDVGEVLAVRQRAAKGAARISATPITLCQALALDEGDTFTVGGFTLTATAVTPNGVCTDSNASVTVSAADFQVDGATVSGLSLTMNAAGISGSVTSVTLPQASAVSVSGTLSATWTGSFSGSLSATGLFPYLPLPDGWAPSSATVSFSGADISLSATATGPDEGQAVLSGDLNSDGSFSLSLAVQNAVQITGYDGSSAMYAGSGTVSRASGAGLTYDVQLGMSTSGLQILDDVTLGSASLAWDNSGLTLSGSVTTTIGSDSVAFTATAQITDATDWTATISSTATPAVGSLPLASLSGTFTYNSALTFDVTASVSNVQVSGFLGLDITTASAAIQNDDSDLELNLSVAGSVVLFSDTIDVNTTVDVDITTGEFDADFSLGGAGFGPSQAQLTAVNFFVADDGASDPALVNNPCAPTGTSGTVYGFTATATILSDASFQVTGVYQGASASNPGGSGYCFYGQVASADIPELSSVSVADSLDFLYSTYATTAAGQSIPATSPTMWASMALPSQVQTYLNNDVTGFTVLVELVTTSGKVTGLTVNGDVDMSAYVSGSATSLPSFELTSIGISLELTLGSSDGVEVSFDCDGVLTTPGNSAGSMAQSTMDFDASIGLQFGSSNGGGSLNLTANLASDAPVVNAFGVGGLTLQQLGVAAVIGFDALLNSSITFSATNLELPSDISDAIGLSSTAPIDFSLTVGITAPCFYLSIGTPDQTTNAAIDWGGAGVLEAYYFKLLLAPCGNCTESDGTHIAGNFAVDFTGYIFGVSVDIMGTVEIDPDFFADISVTVGGFNLAGLDLDQTIIDLDFNPSAGVFDLNFSGGANLWSTVIIDVSGSVDVDLSATDSSFDIQFDGSMDENLFGIFQSDVWVDLGVDAGMNNGSFYLNELDVSIGGLVKILIFEANASFTLDYQNGGVQVLTGDFAVNVNLYILQFGVSLAFQYDPAVTGNQDLAITISGYVDIDLWLFNIRASVSITIDVDASFLGGSEYHPQPVQQVNAPVSLASSSPNTNPNTWNWNSAMYQGNNFGWLANLTGNYTAVYAAALAFESNGLEQSGPPGYYPSAGSGQMPDPADIPWIMSEDWPGAYTANQTSNAFSVVPTKGTATIGETTAATDTYSELEVTATLPPSPVAGWWSATIYEAQARGISNTYIPDTSCMTQNTTATWNVQIPEVPNASPDNWAWVMLDTNWRMFGSTLREIQNAVYTGFAGSAQNDPVETTLSDLTSQYSWYDAPVPLPFTQSLLGTDTNLPWFTCGYDDFTEQTSLYDFMSELNIPWEKAAPPTYQPDMGYDASSTYNLQPGWGDGWNPYDLEGSRFTAQQAFNVQVSPQSSTCQAGAAFAPVQIQDVWWPANQLWSDPTNGWVPIPSGEYLQLEQNGVLWDLQLYDSAGQQLLWNGSAWTTDGYYPFASDGTLIAGDRDGVLYQSGDDHWTYLAFTSDNPIMAQVQAGDGDPSYTYQPTASLNVCQNSVPMFTPAASQGQAPTSVPTWSSITNITYTAAQVYQVSSPFGQGCYDPSYLPQSGTSPTQPYGAQTPVTGAAGPPVNLATTGWSLRLDPITNASTTVRLYNLSNEELRWFDGAWNTEPAGGWPSGAVAFAGDPATGAARLYSASVTGVWVAYGSSYLYLWFSADNLVTDPSDFLTGWFYEPDLNVCSDSVATYTAN